MKNAILEARNVLGSSFGLAGKRVARPNVYVGEEGCEDDWNASWR
jgi:hypothetical protein